jgi:hypothetical protein
MSTRTIEGSNYDPLNTLTQDGEPLDVSSAEITYTIKLDKTAAGSPLIQKENLAAGGDATQISMGPEINQFSVHLIPADTALLLSQLDKDFWAETKVIVGGSTFKRMDKLYIEQSLTA